MVPSPAALSANKYLCSLIDSFLKLHPHMCSIYKFTTILSSPYNKTIIIWYFNTWLQNYNTEIGDKSQYQGSDALDLRLVSNFSFIISDSCQIGNVVIVWNQFQSNRSSTDDPKRHLTYVSNFKFKTYM